MKKNISLSPKEKLLLLLNGADDKLAERLLDEAEAFLMEQKSVKKPKTKKRTRRQASVRFTVKDTPEFLN